MQRTITANELQDLLAADTSITLLDVRRSVDREQDPSALPGARWLDPAAVEDWRNDLTAEHEIVLYCVRGGSVSNAVVDALQASGLKARFIAGGLEAWKAAGGATG
jgi:rhodanese-related sulfurtransferase